VRKSTLALLSVLAACEPAAAPNDAASAGKPSAPLAVFPAPGDIAALPSLPPPVEAFGADAVTVDRWAPEAESPAEDDASRYDDPSPWGGLAHGLAEAHADAVRLSPALRCAAAEAARFRVQNGGIPSESLRRFLAGRCGSTSTAPVVAIWPMEISESATDQQIFDHAAAAVRASLEKVAGPRAMALGIATARKGKHAAIAAFYAPDDVRFEGLTRTVDGARRVVLRGTLRVPGAQLAAVINRGEMSTAVCERDPAPELPAFAFSCELAPGDRSAWVDIADRQPGRALANAVADVLVAEGDPAKLEYHPRASGAPVTVSDADGLSAAFLVEVNRVRQTGKLAPLSLAKAQSAEATRLAGTLIDASLHQHNDLADRISLGLLAGWNVEGMIRDGSFVVGLAPTRDATALVSGMLERPFGRMVLLDPHARLIALGAAVPGGNVTALGAAVATYQLFESPDHAADAARVLQRLLAARAALGKPAFDTASAPPELTAQIARVLSGDEEPMSALAVAMHAFASTGSGTLHGYVAEATQIDAVPIPPELLRLPKAQVAVAVTHHKAKGAAWGQLVVFYMAVTSSETSWN
jgi:hypothetical protein